MERRRDRAEPIAAPNTTKAALLGLDWGCQVAVEHLMLSTVLLSSSRALF